MIPTDSLGGYDEPVLRPPKNAKIRKLLLPPDAIGPARIEGKGQQTFVHVKGRFTDPNATLVWGSYQVKTARDGSFDVAIPISGMLTNVDFISIDPYGEAVRDRYEIFFKDWNTYQAAVVAGLTNDSEQSRPPISVGLGLSSIGYTETGVEDFSSIVLTAKAGYSRPFFSDRWSIGAGAYLNLIPITESYSASARFFGLNFRFGYHPKPTSSSWKVSYYFGTFYTTMYVAGDIFGFNNMIGPQFYPVFTKNLKNDRAIRAYLKFAPLVSTVSVLTLKSREIAAGGEYVYKVKDGKPRSIQLDASQMNVQFPEQTISVNTLSLSLSYAL